MSKPRAFTLIELLVVISIIALIIALLLPSLGKSKESAVRVNCLTRVKGAHTGSSAYAADNREYFPYRSGGTFMVHQIKGTGFDLTKSFAKPYLGDNYPMMFCPGKLHDVRSPTTFAGYPDTYYTIQYLNYEGAGWLVPKADLKKATCKPQYALWSCLTTLKDSGRYLAHDIPETPLKPTGQNAVLADGSGAWYPWEQMEALVLVSSHYFYWPKPE